MTTTIAVEYELKTWMPYFEEVVAGRKRHEVRNTQGLRFRVGHLLLLREWNRDLDQATGRTAVVEVTYISKPGTFGLGPHVCVLSIEVLTGANT